MEDSIAVILAKKLTKNPLNSIKSKISIYN
jgi:hypothetical protein